MLLSLCVVCCCSLKVFGIVDAVWCLVLLLLASIVGCCCLFVIVACLSVACC